MGHFHFLAVKIGHKQVNLKMRFKFINAKEEKGVDWGS